MMSDFFYTMPSFLSAFQIKNKEFIDQAILARAQFIAKLLDIDYIPKDSDSDEDEEDKKHVAEEKPYDPKLFQQKLREKFDVYLNSLADQSGDRENKSLSEQSQVEAKEKKRKKFTPTPPSTPKAA